MRNIIKNFYLNNPVGPKLINPLLRFRNLIIPQRFLLKTRFKRTLGYRLNLTSPATLNEKIQWLKLNDHTRLHTICADKFEVRGFIKERIGEEYLIPLIYNTTNPSDIVEEVIPDYPVIIKTNHDSAGGIVIRDKAKTNWLDVQKKLQKRLASNYSLFGKGEWQYTNIPARIIIEKLLLDIDGQIPKDFKMHCFNGKLAFTQVDIDRHTDHKRNLYDRAWNFIPCKWAHENGPHIPKPDVYDKMIELAESLANVFIYVRVDFYVISPRIYFGEMTFHSGSGNEKFSPQEFDLKLGKKLKLP